MSHLNTPYQFLVAGSGIIGLTTALTLLKKGFKVTLHTNKKNTNWNPLEIDLRVSAISSSSLEFFSKLGVNQQLINYNPNNYSRISLNTKGVFNFTCSASLSFKSDTSSSSCKLGVMIENNGLTDALLKECQNYPSFNLLIDSELTFKKSGDKWIDSSNQEYDLVLACDGAHSSWREKAYINVQRASYNITCMLALVDLELPDVELDHTWQVICQGGPRALLPLNNSQSILCYYDSNKEFKTLNKQLANVSNDQVLELVNNRLKDKFSFMPYKFSTVKFQSFPLNSLSTKIVVRNGVVILGDAAHVVTPMLGQGVNLGIQDIKRLSESLNSFKPGTSNYIEMVCENYQIKTSFSYKPNIFGFDLVHRMFSQDNSPYPTLLDQALKLIKIKPLESYMISFFGDINQENQLSKDVKNTANSALSVFQSLKSIFK